MIWLSWTLTNSERFAPWQGQSGGAVRLVADDEIECPEALLLRIRYHLNRLIGGKDQGAAIPDQGVGRGNELCSVGGCGISQIVGGDVFLVSADFGIRTDDKGMNRLHGLGRLFPQRLGDQRNRGGEK